MTFQELRELSSMNMTQFAKYFGIPYRTVQDWNAGRSNCPPYLIDLMAYKLNIVQCNDCEYCNPFCECSHPVLCSDDPQAFLQVSGDGFCSYGKRKVDNANVRNNTSK